MGKIKKDGDNSAKIYANPDVYKPMQNGGLEAPTYTDIRGTINRIDIEGKKINILFTRKGFMRSGDLHKNIQFDFVFSGKLELWLRKGNRDIKKIYKANDFIAIPPNVPHLFNFLEDTLMAEWWSGPFEAWYFKPYRSVIDEQFKKMVNKK